MTRDEAQALLSRVAGRKSSYSADQGTCVAVAGKAGVPFVGLQDTKQQPDDQGKHTTIFVSARAFAAFVGYHTR
jgi:hypothetical protein